MGCGISLIFCMIGGVFGVYSGLFGAALIPTPTLHLAAERVITQVVVTEILPEFIPCDQISSIPTCTPLPTPTQPAPPTIAFQGMADCIPDNPPENGIVSKIIDGDTIEVFVNQNTYKVRYIGIDAPELKGEPFADQATQLNRELVDGKSIILVKDVSETDKYDRLLRYVMVENKFVNFELVRQGLAFARDYPPDIACSQALKSAQTQARADRLMLWSPTLTMTSAPSSITPVITPITRSGDAIPCDCTGPDLQCDDFITQAAAQTCWDYCSAQGISNPFDLDGFDHDNKVCEYLP